MEFPVKILARAARLIGSTQGPAGKEPMSQTLLFCLPFAGGNAMAYNVFQPHLPGRIDLVPLDLPGHGRRAREPLLARVDEMVEDMLQQLINHGGLGSPYALFGHSMGALLSYLLAHRVVRGGMPAPVHLLLSGKGAPKVDRGPVEKKSALPKSELITQLREAGGFPPHLLEEPNVLEELAELIEPVIRNDFNALEEYQHQPAEPLDVPITLFCGSEDNLGPCPEVDRWRNETRQPVNHHELPGDHFFLFQEPAKMAKKIAEALR